MMSIVTKLWTEEEKIISDFKCIASAKNLNHNSGLTRSEKVKMFGACKLLSLGINV